MATLLLMPSTGSPAVTPTPSGSDWDHINTVRRPLRFVPSGSAMASETYSPDGSDHDVSADAMIVQFTSGIWPAQTISALPIALFLAGWETSPNNNLFPAWKLYAVNPAGSSVLGTLVARVRTSALELPASTEAVLQGRSDVRTATAFDSSGDPFRLTLEVGAGGTPSGGRHNFGMMFGDVFADGNLALIQHGVQDGNMPMLLFSEELLPPVDDGVGGSTYGSARML